jgi:type I restriction enzyme, S subunit
MGNQVSEEKILKIDKSKWKPTKLGTLAEDISIRVDKPENSEYDRFVGLDNFVSGDIKIKSWSSTKNLTSSAKAFKAGDILFARRNAYLRRASLVDFDGCCSGDAFVIRENVDKVVPGFLAFLMNTNSLWDYANSNAAGTMSKRVKWRDLAEYEFLLPPKNEQARFAELLWALEELIEKEEVILDENLKIKKACLRKLANSKHGVNSNLGDFIEIENGYAFKGEFISDDITDRILMTPGNFKVGGGFLYDKIKYYKSENFNTKFIFKPGEMVITMTDLSKEGDTLGYPAFVPEIEGKIILHNQRLGKVVVKNNKLNFDFIYYLLQTPTYRSHILNAATKTTVRHTYANRIKSFKFFQPNNDIQLQWVSKFKAIDQIESVIKTRILSSQSLQKSLINQIF